MRLVIQRVSSAEVRIDETRGSRIGRGLLVLFATREGDTEESCGWLADKAVNLRIFDDDAGKMNRSALDIGGEIMVVSQFTLYADTRKGRRPSYGQAQKPEQAQRLYNRFVELVAASGLKTETGVFGAKMDVRLTNDGPVTIIVDHDQPEC